MNRGPHHFRYPALWCTVPQSGIGGVRSALIPKRSICSASDLRVDVFPMKSILARTFWGVVMSCSLAISLSAQGGGETKPQPTQKVVQDLLSPPVANSPPPNSPPGNASSVSSRESDIPETPQPQNVQQRLKRVSAMISDFENPKDVTTDRRPLTAHEKFIISLHQAFDVSAHVGNAFEAALEQAANSQPHYGEGWGAYGKRFAANEGDQVSGSILIYGVLPSILHEDPRYFRKGRGTTLSRMWYAATRTFVARRDDGTSGFNNSEIFGQIFSSSISTSYYPQQDRCVSHVFSNWGVNLAGNSGYNILSEYRPDMKRLFLQHHRKPVVMESKIDDR